MLHSSQCDNETLIIGWNLGTAEFDFRSEIKRTGDEMDIYSLKIINTLIKHQDVFHDNIPPNNNYMGNNWWNH